MPPSVGVFVIQGGPEVELGAPVDKRHVSRTHNALSVRAKVVWKRGSAGRGCEGGWEPQGCNWEGSHSRCGKNYPSLQYTHICIYTHEHSSMEDNRKKNSMQHGRTRHGMMSWVVPFQQRVKASLLFWRKILEIFSSQIHKPPNLFSVRGECCLKQI